MESTPITVVIVEDQEIVRVGLQLMLSRLPDVQVLVEVADGEGAVSACVQLCPTVALMDITLPKLDGIEATRQIKTRAPSVRVLMLTGNDSDDAVFASLSAGADGYCLKESGGDQIALAIRVVATGAAWIHPAIAKKVLDHSNREPVESPVLVSPGKLGLSHREGEVLNLVVEGLSNGEMAGRLCISTETVKTHMRHIMDKLAVSDRTQAAVKALREGLVSGT